MERFHRTVQEGFTQINPFRKIYKVHNLLALPRHIYVIEFE
jgi:hypothetical protein